MASVVSARLLNAFLRALVAQNVDVDSIVGDLPIESTDDPSRTALIAWDDVAELGVRLERRLGGADALVDLGATLAASHPMPAMRRLAGVTSGSHALYRTALRWLELHMPRDLTTHVRGVGEDQLEIRIIMPSGSASCPAFFHLLEGIARSLPRQLDLDEAVVTSRIQSNAATFVVTPPTSGTIWRRGLRSLRTLLGSNAALAELEEDRHRLRHDVDQLERALFDTTARESTLRTLVAGSTELLLVVGHDGRIHAASESSRRVTGYVPDQIVGSHLALWFHRDDDAAIRGLLDRAFSGERFDSADGLRARHEDGRWLDTHVEQRGGRLDGDLHGVVLAVAPARHPDEHADRDELAARLQRLERRHDELKEAYEKLRQSRQSRPAHHLDTLIDASVAAAVGPDAEPDDAAPSASQSASRSISTPGSGQSASRSMSTPSAGQSASRSMSTPSARSFSSRRS